MNSSLRERSILVRRLREGAIYAGLIACAAFTVAITATIIGILAWESWKFFAHSHPDAQGRIVRVSPVEFLTSFEWTPLLGQDTHFGIWPLIVGTAKVTAIAMAFALPLGLTTALWLSEYASPRVRGIIKPTLELLAGIPTVVLGFFALIFITPVLKLDFASLHPSLECITLRGADGQPLNPLGLEGYNALAAGIAVGILCLPIVTSMAEDAVRAVPKALREAAYGLGGNKFETSVKVVVPAALSGIISAFLLAISRAVGETMVVALAAGSKTVQMLALSTGPDGQPQRDAHGQLIKHVDFARIFSIADETQVMTAYMVDRFKGDAPHGTVEFSSSFAVAATLFVITLGLTLIGNAIRRRYRQAYQ